jgi:hypothetical protein
MAFCWDRSEVTEYQYGRHTKSGIKIFDAGDGYACAVKPGKTPPWDGDDFGQWKLVDNIGGWNIWTAGVS